MQKKSKVLAFDIMFAVKNGKKSHKVNSIPYFFFKNIYGLAPILH